MATRIARFNIDFTANSSQLRKVFGNVKRDAGGLVASLRKTFTRMPLLGPAAGALGAGLSTRAIVTSFQSVAAEMDNMAKTARRLGIATESMGALEVAASRSGVELNTVTMALQRMTRRASEAARGTGEAKDAIAELGLDAARLSRLRPEKALGEVGDALLRISSQSDRVRLAFKLFDSEGVRMLQVLEKGSAGMAEFTKEAERLGKVFSAEEAAKVERYSDAVGRLADAWSGMKRATVTKTAGPLSSAMEVAPRVGSNIYEKISPILFIFRKLSELRTPTALPTTFSAERMRQMNQQAKDAWRPWHGGRPTDAMPFTEAQITTAGASRQQAQIDELAKASAERISSALRNGLDRVNENIVAAGQGLGVAVLKGVEKAKEFELASRDNPLTAAIKGWLHQNQRRMMGRALIGLGEHFGEMPGAIGNLFKRQPQAQLTGPAGGAFLSAGTSAAFSARMRGVSDARLMLETNRKTERNTGRTVKVLEAVKAAIEKQLPKVLVDAPQRGS